MENNINLIKSRLLKATPGKWEWVKDEVDLCVMPIVLSDGAFVMGFGDSEPYYATEGTPPNENDAEFIVNAKSDIEYLIEKCERYEKALNKIASEKMSHYETSDYMVIDFRGIARRSSLNE